MFHIVGILDNKKLQKNKISDIFNSHTNKYSDKGHDKLSKFFKESPWLVETDEYLIYYYLSSRIMKSNSGISR